jgi:hypothetical protein
MLCMRYLLVLDLIFEIWSRQPHCIHSSCLPTLLQTVSFSARPCFLNLDGPQGHHPGTLWTVFHPGLTDALPVLCAVTCIPFCFNLKHANLPSPANV